MSLATELQIIAILKKGKTFERYLKIKKVQALWYVLRQVPVATENKLTQDWKLVKPFDKLFKWVTFVMLQKDPQWDEQKSTPTMNKRNHFQRQEIENMVMWV